jgi:hypothetical protein
VKKRNVLQEVAAATSSMSSAVRGTVPGGGLSPLQPERAPYGNPLSMGAEVHRDKAAFDEVHERYLKAMKETK